MTEGGGAAAGLPIPGAHEAMKVGEKRVVVGGFVVNVGVNVGQTLLTDAAEEAIDRLHDPFGGPFLP